MSLLRCRALLSVPGPLFNGSPSALSAAWSAESPSLLLHSLLLSLTPRIPRSLTRRSSILYLLYRRDQSRRIPRACAARNERSPVSCLSFRPSVQRTGRPVACLPSMPPTRPFSRGVPLRTRLPSPPPRLLPAIFARSVPSLFYLVTVDAGPYPDTRGPVALFSRNLFRIGINDFSLFLFRNRRQR